LRPFLAAGVDLVAIEARALLGIAQQRVGGRDVLELLLGLLVAGVEIGMELLGETAIGLLDVVRGRVLLYSQKLVWIGRQGVLLRGACRRCGLVWRFRSPHHSCSESEMRTSEPKPH